ncbi:hypothetical protein [Flavonifractor plautii]|uniref:hypothetical protein n=1 Tax=Flavonifractor plautii TaxID=292800 RepID=UPI001FF5852E|nr:hypothetical protein [Flavonifractor plautii]UOX45950.1 hypothetical protein K5I25_22920 [Flavonifractor plautii]
MNDERATVRVRLNLDADCYELAAKVWRSIDMELDFYEFLALELQIRLIELSGFLEDDKNDA